MVEVGVGWFMVVAEVSVQSEEQIYVRLCTSNIKQIIEKTTKKVRIKVKRNADLRR